MFGFLHRLLGRTRETSEFAEVQTIRGPEAPAKVPAGTRVYAVGDIHGCASLLRHMHELVREDARHLADNTQKIIVYLGDYVDRGDTSREVVDELLREPLPGFIAHHLKGNHEGEMLDFLVNPKPDHPWMQYGGVATISSYRVRVANRISAVERCLELRDRLLAAIPKGHHDFFAGLQNRFEIGDYQFVHAGVRPGVDLGQQNSVDYLWIREPFLSSLEYFGKVVVHGHTIVPAPMILPNRIGIDTGAYYTGKLTCLVLEGEERRFLST